MNAGKHPQHLSPHLIYSSTTTNIPSFTRRFSPLISLLLISLLFLLLFIRILFSRFTYLSVPFLI
ncbi:hypothetical protein GQ42DRAFT_57540 [Ramicandelaber brevisporus]|nr:hypothetical protein GQ42DRAFT_57540 [Ramicandelaber brevisporus]